LKKNKNNIKMKAVEEGENAILQLSFNFSLRIIEYCELLDASRKYVISNQLLKSGTSIGANVREAQNAESSADFTHKLKLAAKEADETAYWLLLCAKSKGYPPSDKLTHQLLDIQKLLTRIISTMRTRCQKNSSKQNLKK